MKFIKAELGATMKVGYTEFSYGYAFTENLIRSSANPPVGAPIFPNLLQEALAGFDVRINFPGVPLFFQYKLPELMTARASEISKWNCPGLTAPFFRISLMRRDISDQHKLLRRLEKRYPSCVFYAAGCFKDITDFDRAYNTAGVPKQSAFFSPIDIGRLRDDKVHTIAYQPGLSTAYFCSEPREVQAHNYNALARVIDVHFKDERFHHLGRSVQEIRSTILEMASPSMHDMRGAIAERIQASRRRTAEAQVRSSQEEAVLTDILVTREIARVDLGVDFVIAQPPP